VADNPKDQDGLAAGNAAAALKPRVAKTSPFQPILLFQDRNLYAIAYLKVKSHKDVSRETFLSD